MKIEVILLMTMHDFWRTQRKIVRGRKNISDWVNPVCERRKGHGE